MKKIYTLVLLLVLVTIGKATDRNVDHTGNVPGSFLDMNAAIAAAVDGDKILVYNSDHTFYDTVIVNKSLTITAATPEEDIHLVGQIQITPAPGREVSLIGFLLQGDIIANADNGPGARCIVNIVDCYLPEYEGGIKFNNDNFWVKCLVLCHRRC